MNATRILFFFGMAAVASATSVTFTFDTVTIGTTTVQGLTDTATTAQIQTYMNNVLKASGCSACSVAVSGAFADTTYNADGNVTGPGTGSKSLTLGTSNGATGSNTTSSINGSYDTFLATTNDSAGSTDSQITLTFTGLTISGNTSFDYEIFPDLSCTSLTTANCGGAPVGGIYPNQPDFKFDINGSTPVTSFGTNGIQYSDTPAGSPNDGNTNNSPLSGTELAPQYIGTWSTASLSSTNQLDFIDWPATIGVDNLTFNFTQTSSPTVPEPVSVLLLGTVVAGLALRKKLHKAS